MYVPRDSLVSQGLLPSGPPHRDDDQHRGRDRGLTGAENESEHEQGGKGGEGRADHARCAPAEKASDDPPIDRQPDERPDGHWTLESTLAASRQVTDKAGRQAEQSRL